MGWVPAEAVIFPIETVAAQWLATDLLGLVRFRDIVPGVVLVGVEGDATNLTRVVVADGFSRLTEEARVQAVIAYVREQYALGDADVSFEIRMWEVVPPEVLGARGTLP